jgi:hypothetical protein
MATSHDYRPLPEDNEMINMDSEAMLAAIDEELGKLRQARGLLTSGNKAPLDKKRKRPVMSDEARAKIRAAQKKRWAAWHAAHAR